MSNPQESIQSLLESIDKEIARVSQSSISLQQAIIKIEKLQSSSGQHAAPSQQLATLRQTFSEAKKQVAEMKSRKNALLERLALTQSKSNSDPLDYWLNGEFECEPARLTEIAPNPVISIHSSQKSALEKAPDTAPKAGTCTDRFIKTRYSVDVYAVLIEMENYQAFIKHAVEKELIAQTLLPDEWDKLFSSISHL